MHFSLCRRGRDDVAVPQHGHSMIRGGIDIAEQLAEWETQTKHLLPKPSAGAISFEFQPER